MPLDIFIFSRGFKQMEVFGMVSEGQQQETTHVGGSRKDPHPFSGTWCDLEPLVLAKVQDALQLKEPKPGLTKEPASRKPPWHLLISGRLSETFL